MYFTLWFALINLDGSLWNWILLNCYTIQDGDILFIVELHIPVSKVYIDTRFEQPLLYEYDYI